ncbi:MAG: oxygen-independent coproporphyrinogen III oxidase [Flammeovirgaceae bacterium]
MNHLLNKYNVPGPRYTSYPTVPYWDKDGIRYSDWENTVRKSFIESNSRTGISLYIHLPYCESLCTFCGCNKKITKNHAVEQPYLEAVLREWDLYLNLFPQKPVLKDLHIGGGTPTFFSPENLEKLMDGILSKSIKHPEATFGFEGHPNNTQKEHLKAMKELGFERVSYGIQDFDAKVQEVINRIQSFENVEKVTKWSRELAYQSINFDVVYGLPFQTLEGLKDTFQKISKLMPERIAFYSYAHVPWIKGTGQRKFTEEDLPAAPLKRQLYETGRDILQKLGYKEIGMDHFSLTNDALYQAVNNKTLHRNFMGYTPSTTQLMIGLGASSIGDTWYSFAQNEKEVDIYLEKVQEGKLPIFRGHLLSEDDLIIRKHILNLMCKMQTSWTNQEEISDILERLEEVKADNLVEIKENTLLVKEEGKAFLRNICMAFDRRLWADKPQTKIFSMTI